MRRICIYGGPSSGKSTVAAYVFSHMKKREYNVELAREYIKNWAYLNTPTKSFDQLYVFAKQLREEDILLRSGVGYVVTDSPLMLQLAYIKKYRKEGVVADLYDELFGVAKKFDLKFPSLNIFLDRTAMPYKEEGRWENYQQALEMDKAILEVVQEGCDHYQVLPTNNIETILAFVIDHA